MFLSSGRNAVVGSKNAGGRADRIHESRVDVNGAFYAFGKICTIIVSSAFCILRVFFIILGIVKGGPSAAAVAEAS